ncbi:Uncharacterised protein [Bacteroides eggerthii]|uniref:Uncharacterized protein n=1 Tax=Bacteroides eggerthii TaxID=28111 RepID=A0A380ZDN4_9BACE|nr:Uncharacterised protein [Bacteroides eggerthii]
MVKKKQEVNVSTGKMFLTGLRNNSINFIKT